MKIINSLKKNFINIYIIMNILLIFINSYRLTIYKISYYTFSYYLVIAMIINIIIIGVYLIYKAIKKQKYRIKLFDWLILLILFLTAISMLFAINREFALLGSIYRYEGINVIVYYFSILFLSSITNKDTRKIIIYTILLTGVFQAVYGFLQANELKVVELSYNYDLIWVNGLTCNPNFFGSYMLICLSYSLGLLIEDNSIIKQIINVILVIIFMIGLLISNATSCAVALIALLIFIAVYCIKNKYYEKLICIILLISFTTMVINNEKMTTLVKDVIKTKNETIEIAKGNIQDNYGTKRIKIWKETLKIVPKYLVHGAGVDNYLFAFGKSPLRVSRNIYDKAHNEYLQILVTEGIFSLLTYLLLYFLVVIYGIEYTYKNKKIYLLLPVMGYMIQAFFNISVIEVAPIFYISFGLLIDRDYKNKHILYSKYIKRILDIIISLVSIIVLIPIYAFIALIIKIVDKSNVIYTQIRTGKNGKEFKIYKFKTMDEKHRVTKFGKLLRTTSLDELPQLFNVLKGDMSLIGPRPWITDYYKRFNDEQKKRVTVRPGIIGLAQAKGRNSIGIFQKIDYDLKYVNNITFINDLLIFIESFKVLFIEEDEKFIENNIKKELRELSKKNIIKVKKDK